MTETNTMRDAEIMQRAIAILTVAGSARSNADFTAIASGELSEILGDDVRIAVPLLSDDDGAVVDRMTPLVAEAVAAVLRRRVAALVMGFVTAFIELAEAYERDVPDADVSAVLQQLSLRLATHPGAQE